MAENWKEDPVLRRYFADLASLPPLSREREVELAARIHQGDMGARDELVRANLRFVIDVANQYQNRGLSLPDLIAAGNAGLITAAERFDGTRGFKFISYAVWWIRQAILQVLAEDVRTIRLPLNQIGLLGKTSKVARQLRADSGVEPTVEEIAAAMDVSAAAVRDAIMIGQNTRSLDRPFADQDHSLLDIIPAAGPAPDQAALAQGQSGDISSALEVLDEREQEIIRLYFGLGGEEPMTLEDIGARLHLTRERIRQLKDRALGKLRHPAQARGLILYSDIDVEAGGLPGPEELAARAKEHSGRARKKQPAAKKAKPAPAGKNGSSAPRQRVRRWTAAQIAARNAEDALARAPVVAAGPRVVPYIRSQAVDEAVIASIKRLRAKLGGPPTPEEVCEDVGGGVLPDQVPKIVQAYRERQAKTPAP